MTEKRIKAREAEKKYRMKQRYLQSNRSPEQQEIYRNMWNKYGSNPNIRKYKNEKSLESYYHNRDERLKYAKQYRMDHPDVALRGGKKYLEKLGKDLGILDIDVKRVLMSWKRTIQKRDKTCQICGSMNNLNAHHIFHRKYYPKLTLNINNGILLCRKHHYEVHGWVMVK